MAKFVLLVISFLSTFFTLPLSAQKPRTASSNFSQLSASANAARDANRLDEAVTFYKKALAIRPRWAEGWWSLGTIQYDRNAYPDALRAFSTLIRLRRNDGTAHVMLGLSEFELGQDAPALAHIERGKKLGLSKDPQLRNVVLFHEAVLLQRASRFEAAKETLDQLCLEAANESELAANLGMAMLRMPDRNLPQNSPDAEILRRIGSAACVAARKNYEQARKDFEAVVQQYPQYPNIHYAYGMFLLEAQDTAAAIREFKEEINRSPDHVFARLQIAAANYKVDSAAGLPYVVEAVRLNSRLPLGHYLLGLLYLDIDQYQKAIPELEIAKKYFPRESKLYFALGSAYARAGRQQEAKRARETFARLQQQEQARGEENSGLVPR